MTLTPALTAAMRTFEQTIYAGLATITAGGAILGATDLAHIQWRAVGAAALFLLIIALGASLKSYLSFALKGVPDAYTASNTDSVPAVVSAAVVDATGTLPDDQGADTTA